MASANLNGWGMWGGAPTSVTRNAGYWGYTLDTSGKRIAAIIQVPKTGTLNRFGWHITTVAQAPTNGLRFSFQNVDASGQPDATQDQYADVTSGITANTWLEPSNYLGSTGLGSGTKRSVTAGEVLACVIEFVSFNASDSVRAAFYNYGTLNGVYWRQFYSANYNGAAWTKAVEIPSLALRYDDGTYVAIAPDWFASSALFDEGFNSGSTPDERGLRFTVPGPVSLTGVWWYGNPANDYDLVIYDDTTAVSTTAVDISSAPGTGSGGNIVVFAPVALTTAGTYRAVLKPGGSNVNLEGYTVPSIGYLDTFPGGQNWYYSARTDAGAWTDTTTKRPHMGLLLSAIDDGEVVVTPTSAVFVG